MALVSSRRDHWWGDPFSELENIQREINRMIDCSLSRTHVNDTTLLGGQWTPAVDIYDSSDNILIKAELPGLEKDEIEISVQDNNLIIKGEKKKEQEIKEDNYFRTERFYGSFCRMVPLPADVDPGRADTRYQDGILSLTLPKKAEAKPKQIKIEVK